MKLFLIDLDDTLVGTTYLYSKAIAEFCVLLYSDLKHDVPYILDLIKLQKEIDFKNIEKKGFKEIDRFGDSLIEVYHTICSQTNKKTDKFLEHKIRTISLKPFDLDNYFKQGLIDGVEETLEFLVEKKDELHIVTLGNEEIQKNKINTTNLKKYFTNEKIHVVDKSKNETFKKLSEHFDKNNVIVVGDSLKSDIISAVSSGLKAVHVKSQNWDYDKTEKPFDASRVKEIQKINELIQIYEQL